MTELKTFTLRLDPLLHERLVELAAQDRRPLAHLISAVLACWVNGESYRPTPTVRPSKSSPDASPYRPRRGPPIKPIESRRDKYLIADILQFSKGLAEIEPNSFARLFIPEDNIQGYPKAIENQLILIGWQPVTRVSDGVDVWIPDAPTEPQLPDSTFHTLNAD